MLDIIRNLVSSIFGKILLALMVLSFALWGVGDILTSGNTQLAAKAGNYKITLNQFYNNFQRAVSEFNQQIDQDITLAEAHERQIDLLVVNELVYEKMTLAYADKKNIYISDDIIKKIIKSFEQFQNEDGSFNKLKYDYSIQTNFGNENEFIDEIKLSYLKNLMFDNFIISKSIDNRLVNLLYNHEAETRNIEYITLDQPIVDQDNIPENESSDFFKKNIEKYRIPKQIFINYIEVDFENIKKDIVLSDETIREFYNININDYKQEALKTIKFARLNDKENAKKIKDHFIDDEKLNIYATENDIKINEIENLRYSDFDKNLSSEIFKLSVDEISDVIKVDELGYYVVKVISEVNEVIIPYEEAKIYIYDEIISEQAYEIFDEYVTIADELNLEGFDLDYIANELNLNINKNINLNTQIKKINDTDMMVELYDQGVGFQSEVIINDSDAIIMTISSIEDTKLPSFKDTKNDVVNDLVAIKKSQILKDNLSNAITGIKLKGIEGFNDFALNNRLEKKEIKNLNRSTTNNQIPKEIIDIIFDSSRNDIIDFENKGEYQLLIVRDIIMPIKDQNNIAYENIKNNIYNNYNISIQNNLEKNIISNIEYEIFNQNISNLF